MKNVAVVDAEANELARALNRVADKERHRVQYYAALSPDALLSDIGAKQPQLVLLHHTWDGVTVAGTIERIGSKSVGVRVIVFTGRELELREVIECVRLGVCDYWKKAGTVDFTAWARKISAYCDNEAYTLRSLSQPAGSVAGLLRKAESDATDADQMRSQLLVLQGRLDAARSEEEKVIRTTLARGLEFLATLVVLGLTFAFLAERVSEWMAVIVLFGFLVFFLFLQGRVAKAILNWRDGNATMEASKRRAEPQPPNVDASHGKE